MRTAEMVFYALVFAASIGVHCWLFGMRHADSSVSSRGGLSPAQVSASKERLGLD